MLNVFATWQDSGAKKNLNALTVIYQFQLDVNFGLKKVVYVVKGGFVIEFYSLAAIQTPISVG